MTVTLRRPAEQPGDRRGLEVMASTSPAGFSEPPRTARNLVPQERLLNRSRSQAARQAELQQNPALLRIELV